MSEQGRARRLVSLVRTPTGFDVLIDLANEGDMPLGLRIHTGERDRQLQRAMARSRKPIGQKVVGRVLGITSAERSRWGKDGRLPTSGSMQIRRGTTITLPTYSPIVIEQLANCPALVAEWRAQDRAR